MTTATQQQFSKTNPPKLNDRVIVVEKHSDPAQRTVTKVTPSGKQFYFDGGDKRYQMDAFQHATGLNGDGKSIDIYPYTDERWAEVQEARLNQKRRQQEEDSVRKAREQKVADKKAEELAQLRTLLAGGFMHATTLPDGSRLYTHTFAKRMVPCEMADGTIQFEDRGWVTAIVSVRNVMENCWDSESHSLVERKRFEGALTYLQQRNGSFSGCGSERYDSEDDALIESLHYAYFRAW